MSSNFSFGSSDLIENNTGTNNTSVKALPAGAGVREYNAEVRRMFSENCSPLIDRSGMTQREISEKAGIKEFALSRMVRGLLTPKPDQVKTVAEILEVTPDDLVPGYVREGDEGAVRFVQEVLSNGKVYVRFEGAVTREQASILIAAVNNVMGLGQD